jgi:hypothetical protein
MPFRAPSIEIWYSVPQAPRGGQMAATVGRQAARGTLGHLQPLGPCQPCVPCRRRLCTRLKASPVEKDGAGANIDSWRRSSARWLDRYTRWSRSSTSWTARIARGGCSVAGGPGRTLSLSCQQHLTLPAVARATAGHFVQCGWLLGRGVCVRCSCIGKDVGARRSFEPRDRARRSRDSDTRRRGCTADCVRVT